jgi:FixJ family two-component response regulator
MGGLQLQSHLASSGRHIPIVFITTSTDAEARARALEVGAVDFLRKPSGEEALLKEVRSTLRLKDANDKPR